ncbi:FprA family A-type flavoprotein [Ruminococcaceae bacterium OttesenSCG-928-O06]|nr:FprA family A-type flavoprotein [Ruminococcaceae bacterium OttesenSCG-928-O06]
MGALQAMDNVWFVGVLDKDLRVFDIIMETERGTTYNSYIVKGKDKTLLVEAVKDKFYDEFIANIREVCDPADIDYILVSHTEPDHTGCLQKVLQEAPKATVLAGQTGITFLKEIINAPFPHQVVTEQDTIDLGGVHLQFFSVPMLHWPDSIFTWIPEIKALFTCDSFGCHYADDRVFNDLIEGDFFHAYKYYFDNIMGPYKYPHMTNALDKIKGLDIAFIGNGHGPVLRTDIPKYIELYRQWATPAPAGPKTVAVAYVSAYGYTKALAQSIVQGLRAGGVQVEVFDLVSDDMDAAKAALAAADGMLLGSPTLVGDALPPVYEVMIGLNPVIHRGKFAGAFGSFGWSGEAAHNLAARMNQLHMTLPLPEMRVRLKPTEEDLAAAVKFGQDFAAAVKGA